MEKMEILESRFWSKVIRKSEDECWPWIGGLSGKMKYGVLRWTSGKPEKAHRISYEIKYGPFQKEMFVCHSCDNPICVNPNHLFLGRAKDNNLDRDKKGRHKSLLGESHGMHRLLRDGTKKIKEMKKRHDSEISAIAKELGVSRTTVCDVIAGRTWNWLSIT